MYKDTAKKSSTKSECVYIKELELISECNHNVTVVLPYT